MTAHAIVYDSEGFMSFKTGSAILVEIFKKKTTFCEHEMHMKCVTVMCYLIPF